MTYDSPKIKQNSINVSTLHLLPGQIVTLFLHDGGEESPGTQVDVMVTPAGDMRIFCDPRVDTYDLGDRFWRFSIDSIEKGTIS